MGGLRIGPFSRRGAGQGPVHDWDGKRSAANVSTGGLVSPLMRPPTMRRAGAEPVQELVAVVPPRSSRPWGEPSGHCFHYQRGWPPLTAMGSFSFTTDIREDRTLQLSA